jgi:hypothetical protein
MVGGADAAVGQDSVVGMEPAAARAPEVDRARGEIAMMDATRQRIYRDYAAARDQRDIVKSLCLDDKLNQIDVALRTAGEHLRALEQASRIGDRDAVNHERMLLDVLGERARAVDGEAHACVDKTTIEKGEPDGGGRFEEPPRPGEEATVAFPVPPVIIEPPACASCFR